MATRRIGILTGGGDVPGRNSVIKGVTDRALEMGYEVLGIRRGWEGLTHLKPGAREDERYLVELDRENTRTIDRTGGTWLHSSRTNPRKMKRAALPPTLDAAEAETMRTGDDRYDITSVVMRNIETLGLNHLIPIGGDDTLSYSRSLHDAGINVIAVPKTMDNDLQGT
jgi:6-phosphofructokinase 1